MNGTSDFGTRATHASFTIDFHVGDPGAQPTGHIRIRTVSWRAADPLNYVIDDNPELLQREVLASLGHLRIEKARIKPLASGLSKAGGNADVEAAKLLPQQFSESSESDGAVYVAVKKLRYDVDADDDQALGVSPTPPTPL